MSKLTIGLTGGIASGKTLVADGFIALGVPVLDADQVARDVVAPGQPALTQIAETFGLDFLNADGTLNRARMREHVFGQPAALRQLEAITHPAIRRAMRDWQQAQTTPYCMLSVAILVESRMRELVDRILVVDVPVEVQLARLMSRDGSSEVLARQMIAAQTTRELRLAAAHDVIVNQGTLEQAMDAVGKLHARYLKLSQDVGTEQR